MTSLADLLQPVSEDEATALVLGTLDALGFPATSWQQFAVPRVLTRLVARIYSAATKNVATIAAGGLNSLAKGGWMTLFAKSAYDNDRYLASPTVGLMQLADVGGNGPTPIAPGQVVVQTPDGLLLWSNQNAATLPQGGVVSLSMIAEQPGAAYNIASNYPGLQLVTTLPGVVVSNPVPVGATTWITTPGADDESDALLAQRNSTKWPTLATGGQRDAYANWARTGATNITRVVVDDTNPDGPGTVRVYIATAAGPADTGTVAAADAYIQARRALTATVTTVSASALQVTVAATLYVPAASSATATAAAVAAATAVVNGTTIGGTLYYSQVLAALTAGGAVRNVEGLTLNGSAADIVLDADQVPTFTAAITTRVF